MKTILLGIAVALIGTALIWLGGMSETHPYSFWWLTPIIGLALGFIIKPTAFAVVLALCSGGLGWGLPLLYRSTYLAIGKTAAVAGHTPLCELCLDGDSIETGASWLQIESIGKALPLRFVCGEINRDDDFVL